jgi:pimeloyl-ACP methyl ester carboxylesterase
VAVDDGVVLHVRRWRGGGRRPMVLVHGLASNARLWDGVAEALAPHGHPVATVDLRGHGRSAKPDHGYDVATVAEDLHAVLQHLRRELAAPLVAGQSWGGNVVLELAARHPGSVAALACVDGGTIDLQARFASWEDCAAALRPPPLAGTPLADIESMLRRSHPDWPESGIAGTLACFEVRADGTVAPWLTLDRHLQVLRGLWEHRPAERYGDVTVPVLLLAADSSGDEARRAADRSAVADAAEALPRATVEWMTGDHDLHAQHPERVAALLTEHAGRAHPAPEAR